MSKSKIVISTPHDRAAMLPSPSATIPVIVPLALLPDYFVIHRLAPGPYIESRGHRDWVMLCKKAENENK